MEPKIEEFEREVQAIEGQQVTLRVTFVGLPKPSITWTFKGTRIEGDYAIELGSDGSLLFVCVEAKHAGRYAGRHHVHNIIIIIIVLTVIALIFILLQVFNNTTVSWLWPRCEPHIYNICCIYYS